MTENQNILNYIDEVFNYYQEDMTRKQTIGCEYVDPNGCVCAVGYGLSPEDRAIIVAAHKNDSRIVGILTDPSPSLKGIKLERFKDFPLDVLGALQKIHDELDNWDEFGLSGRGKEAVQDLKTRIEEGYYDGKCSVSDYLPLFS